MQEGLSGLERSKQEERRPPGQLTRAPSSLPGDVLRGDGTTVPVSSSLHSFRDQEHTHRPGVKFCSAACKLCGLGWVA